MKRQERTRGGSGGKRAGLAAVDTKAVKFPTQFESVLSRFRENTGPIISKSLPCYKRETLRNPLFSKRVLDWVLRCGKRLRAFVATRPAEAFAYVTVEARLQMRSASSAPFGRQTAILSLKGSGIRAEPPPQQRRCNRCPGCCCRDMMRVRRAQAVRFAHGVFTMR